MICQYIADDGTIFDDYDECEEYERKKNKWNKITESKFWDEDENPMTIDEWLDEAERCDYMEVASDEEAELIHEFLVDYQGLCHPWIDNRRNTIRPTAGRYYYDHSDDDWHNLQTELDRINQIKKVFEGE